MRVPVLAADLAAVLSRVGLRDRLGAHDGQCTPSDCSCPREIPGHIVHCSWTIDRVDVRRLEMLLRLSQVGSMREVAEQLDVTTSTVSQQIAALAREVGTPLLEPVGRRVRLTPAGQRLADHAITILAAVDAARNDLDPDGGPGRHRAGRRFRDRRPALPPALDDDLSTPPQRAAQDQRARADRGRQPARPRRGRPRPDLRLQPRSGTGRPCSGKAPLWTADWGLGVPSSETAEGADATGLFPRHRSRAGS